MTSTIAPPTLATLPTEIFENIFLFLSQHDLTRCVLVSRAWNEALIPHLWRTIPLLGRTPFRRCNLRNTKLALYKNAAFVRELQVTNKTFYNVFFPSLKQIKVTLPDGELTSSDDAFITSPFINLRVLELHFRPLTRLYEFDNGIFEIVRLNPGLRRLKIGVEMEPKALFSLVTEHVPNLFELDIETPWRGDVKALLDNLPERLRTLQLRNVTHQIQWTPTADNASTIHSSAISETMKRPLQHHALESLHIGGNIGGQEEQVLVSFLEGCSQNLKFIRIARFLLSFQYAKISYVLNNVGHTATRARRRDLSQIEATDNILAQVISIGPNWTHIELFNRWIGPMTAAAIVDNCEHLEVLDIVKGASWGLSGSHLQAILSRAPRLRSLQAYWLNGAEKISSVDIFSSGWATTSLEYVDLKIDVPRVAADQEDADDDDSKALRASSRDIQRRVLRRFGQQTHLRKLVVGDMAVSSATGIFGYQFQCLEMTLESGLDELEGLKELEHLDIHHMDHRVGVPELEWMADNLPNLKYLHGVRDSLRPKEGIQEWFLSHPRRFLRENTLYVLDGCDHVDDKDDKTRTRTRDKNKPSKCNKHFSESTMEQLLLQVVAKQNRKEKRKAGSHRTGVRRTSGVSKDNNHTTSGTRKPSLSAIHDKKSVDDNDNSNNNNIVGYNQDGDQRLYSILGQDRGQGREMVYNQCKSGGLYQVEFDHQDGGGDSGNSDVIDEGTSAGTGGFGGCPVSTKSGCRASIQEALLP
ncbi:MAG: hypothetical protein J3R72DRAFT_520261 [Linnemannia gamsii]|nr:MAG: hypothetical protein J3R72DRAFT_520261 [Linnemannia gamsii]